MVMKYFAPQLLTLAVPLTVPPFEYLRHLPQPLPPGDVLRRLPLLVHQRSAAPGFEEDAGQLAAVHRGRDVQGGVAVLGKLRGNGGLFYTIFYEMEAVNERKILKKTLKTGLPW